MAKKPNPNHSTTCACMDEILKQDTTPADVAGAAHIIRNKIIKSQNLPNYIKKADYSVDSKPYRAEKAKYNRLPSLNFTEKDKTTEEEKDYSLDGDSGAAALLNCKPNALKVLITMVITLRGGYNFGGGIQTLAKMTQLSRPTIIHSIDWLIANGYIAVVEQGSGTNPNVYMINPTLIGTGKEARRRQELTLFYAIADEDARRNFKALCTQKFESSKQIHTIKQNDDSKRTTLYFEPKEVDTPNANTKNTKSSKKHKNNDDNLPSSMDNDDNLPNDYDNLLPFSMDDDDNLPNDYDNLLPFSME